MKVTQMPPVHAADLVANRGNTAYGVDVIAIHIIHMYRKIEHSVVLWYCRDQSIYAPSQWETSLQCNNVSHWLGAELDWSLILCDTHTGIVLGRKLSLLADVLLQHRALFQC